MIIIANTAAFDTFTFQAESSNVSNLLNVKLLINCQQFEMNNLHYIDRESEGYVNKSEFALAFKVKRASYRNE